MIPIYRAGWQLVKVRAVMIASLIGLALCLWSGFDLVQSHGLREADGGVLAPLAERIAFGGFVALLGVACAIGMWLYGSHYAARIELDPVTKKFHLTTVGFFWNQRHVLDAADFRHGTLHEDINWNVVLAAAVVGHPVALVNAPWTSVRIRGWQLPLILDHQGVVLHQQLLRKFFVR